ncbi:Na+/H+ antiporter [Brevibacillus dissolubilis]|uniref:Na+/H+ antiporter n=1 Tax=Brevibacillus dissolubilis TaxID=1844116 RepID=UPI0011175702|nr:Na+/H+ antiporter [Brevibacillus dissolubilis]
MAEHFELFILLLGVAAAVTAIANKLGQPYPIALVIVGTLIGIVPAEGLETIKDVVVADELFHFIIVMLFLPTLLGEATLKMPFSHIKQSMKPIVLLAILGTLLSFVLTGFMSMYILGLPLAIAFVFAALMSATDPISVISIFKSMGVPHRLATIMEGESLANDGVAVVFFKISAFSLLVYVEAGAFGLVKGLGDFFLVAMGGAAIGFVLSFLFSQITKFYDDYPLEILFSMLLFYGSFFIAEHYHVSGVIAVVVAGLVYGNYGARIGMTPTTRLNIRSFWDVTALVANSLIFLLVGLEIDRIHLADKWQMVLLAIVIVLVSRSLAVYGSLLFDKTTPWAWRHVFNWGGLKGSLSIALAFSLPRDFPGREDILVLAFGVVLFSLIIQALTIKPLIQKLGLVSSTHEGSEYENLLTRFHRSIAAREELARMEKMALISPTVYQTLDQEYEQQINVCRREMDTLFCRYPQIQEQQIEAARRQTLYAEQEAIARLEHKEIVSPDTAEQARREVIGKLVTLLEKENH